MTNQNCPKCNSSRLQYQEKYGYWECDDCGHIWALDADDPDYDDIDPQQDDRNICSRCGGGGWVQEDGEPLTCLKCGGSGSI